MPMYDRQCPSCGVVREAFERYDAPDPVCVCGGTMRRVWLGKASAVIDDSWPGGKYFEHVSHTGETFYSKGEFKRYLQQTGQMEYVRHQGKPGSDKHPDTTRWV